MTPNTDTEQTLLATAVGGLFSALTHVSEAFLYGFIGALGGLTCKVIYSYVSKKWINKKHESKPKG